MSEALSTADPAPQYLRVKNHLREGISSGRWVAGDLLPSESDLVSLFKVSRMTVNRALRELYQDGLIQRMQGVGTFVADLHRISSTLTVRDLAEEVQARGRKHELRVHLLETVAATAEQAGDFGLRAGDKLFHSVVVHFENGKSIQCEDRLVNPATAPEYLDVDFQQTTPTQYLLKVAPLSEARYTIEALLPSDLEAKLLCISKREPCLVVKRRTFSRGVAVTSVKLSHPGSTYLLEGGFQA
ncbi:histidine utilization repressor [Paucibacter sp. R3-3]|uniref:Histidine utilization repressor n=1 Tax=Roseateles agri TaxID=3098619 RepID=A0ABU5DC31_9BURK|nr:histidine utilization repressor [Paucibacter sp. R3-3]MDY0743827.1 histidine utilization repressor [Paucibacter sp. R3-3]